MQEEEQNRSLEFLRNTTSAEIRKEYQQLMQDFSTLKNKDAN